MIAGLIPEDFPGKILVTIQTVFNHCRLVIGFTAALATLLFSWLLFKKKKKNKRTCSVASLFTTVARHTPDSDASTVTNHALFNGHKGEIARVSDAKYAEDLQFQEALLASLYLSQMADNASSSMQVRPMLNSELAEIAKEADEPSQIFCEICLENKEPWQMFENDRCSHSFCYYCTTKHIEARIRDNVEMVSCPGVNCNAMLDFNACRLMIPREILVCWDETLCNSLILESQKLYCPFKDCSAMLVNESGETISKIKCPVCRRSFCALWPCPMAFRVYMQGV